MPLMRVAVSIGSGDEAGTANRLQRPRWQRLLPGMFR